MARLRGGSVDVDSERQWPTSDNSDHQVRQEVLGAIIRFRLENRDVHCSAYDDKNACDTSRSTC